MSEAKSQSAGTDTDSEETFTYYPQVTPHPTTIIEGTIERVVTGSDIDGDVEDTGSSFGVLYSDPEVVEGTIWQNRNIPDGFDSTSEFNDMLRVAIDGTDIDYIRGREVTDDLVGDARDRIDSALDVGGDFSSLNYEETKATGTDYKIADPSDRDAAVQEVDDTVLGIDVGGGVYEAEQVDSFDGDVMVWYGGVAGQRVGRALDFNGMPFARWTEADDGEDPYFVKGLFQAPVGWRGEADIEQYGEVPSTDRSKLASKRNGMGRPPRAVRPPLLRKDIDGRVFVALGRYGGGSMHEVHVGRALDDYEEFTTALQNDDLGDDAYDAIEMRYDQSPEERLSADFDNPEEVFAPYYGEGWMPNPTGASIMGGAAESDGGSFEIDTDIGDDEVEHPTEGEREFGEGVAEKIAGTGVTPDQPIFPVDGEKTDLAGLVAHNAANFDVEPDVDAIREVVYANTGHLDEDDL